MQVTTADKLLDAVLELQEKYNSETFRFLYDELSPKLYYLCLRYLKNEAEAKDALQETFVIIHEKISLFKGLGSFEGWAKKIAVRHCIYCLKKKKISTKLMEHQTPFTVQKEFDIDLQEAHIKTQLKAALQQLPDGFRTIINLYILEGYTHPEIAEMLNINEGTSRSQLNRAKAALRKLISARK
ncbi:MAG: sigma-70 family RNA polymerase sigma factor [Crocinitomix sp.]|nr:sigma-70 family RNA polymerase sigma factor [Crocinitomix sp.]